MDHPHRLHASAARAAARDFLDAAGLAAPDLDPTCSGDVIAARAAEVLTGEGHLDTDTPADRHELLLNVWGRLYLGCMLALQGTDTGAARRAV